jgi:hypothetical protein
MTSFSFQLFEKETSRLQLTSCEAAGVVKPKARLCEPWDTSLIDLSEPRSGDRSSQRTVHDGLNSSINWLSVAAPRLRIFWRAVTQGSQSLALGLTTPAASQLLERFLPYSQTEPLLAIASLCEGT